MTTGTNPTRDTVWVGVDVGKSHHWVAVVNTTGRQLLSQKVSNDEADLTSVIDAVAALGFDSVWAVDIIGTPSALLVALLTAAELPTRYACGRLVSAMAAGYTGEGKTDAKDAYVIAETARLRRDLPVVATDTDLLACLAVLTKYRADLVADRVRMINRMRDLLTSVFPALEREFDFASCKGALVLLSTYNAPASLRQVGEARLSRWLRARRVRGYADVAARAVAAAHTQHTDLPGQATTAQVIAELATDLLTQRGRLKTLDQQIADTFALHPQAEVITSMPGFGPFLGASLIVAAGDLAGFPTGGHLAAAAGLVPVPSDSGRRVGNMHKPRRYSRPLRHALYLSAQTSMMRAGPNRDYYLKKREQGRTHSQAVIALARRRVDVLWALLRDNRTWQAEPPSRVAQAA